MKPVAPFKRYPLLFRTIALVLCLSLAAIAGDSSLCINGFNAAAPDPSSGSYQTPSGPPPAPITRDGSVPLPPPEGKELKANLEPLGYTNFKAVGQGGMGSVFSAQKGGKTYAFKITNNEKLEIRALNAEFEFGQHLELAYAKEVEKALAEGRTPPPRYFPKSNTYGALSNRSPYLRTELFAQHPDPKNPLHEKPAPSLLHRMDNGTLTPEMEEKVMNQLLDAIAFLHQQDVIHLDLKPANVLVNDLGEIRIIDLGLAAKKGSRSQSISGLPDHEDSIVGTIEYLSPDQMASKVATSRDDVYSLGKLLNEMVLHREAKANGGKPKNAFTRSFVNVPRYIDYRSPPEEVLTNKALAVALFDYHNQPIEKYREGIKKAQSVPFNEFMTWYGGKLREQVQSGDAREVAEKILRSKTLIENYEKGLGLMAEEKIKIEAEIGNLRTETSRFYDESGTPKNLSVPAIKPNPYFFFKEFDNRKPKRSRWGWFPR